MRRLWSVTCALAFGTVLAATPAGAEEQAEGTNTAAKAKCPLSATLESDFYSAYVWRGNVCDDRPVWQPYASLAMDLYGFGSLGAGIWQNYDLCGHSQPHHTFGGLSETDYSVLYSVNVKAVSLEAGHLWYTFPKANGPDYGQSTREIYAKASYGNNYVTPSIAVYRDYELVNGYYIPVGLVHDFTFLKDAISIGPGVTLGFADRKYLNGYYGGDRACNDGVSDLTADIHMSYAITDHLSVGAKLAWTSLLGDEARANVADAGVDTDLVWGGFSVTFTF